MNESPSDRLRVAREKAGYDSAAAFTEAHGITESTYRSHENGTRGLTMAAAKQYAPLLGVEWLWLLEGTGPEQSSPKQRKNPARAATSPAPSVVYSPDQWPRDLPVLGMAECGPGWYLLNGEVIEMIGRPPELAGASKAFVVYVIGTSMEPRYYAGERAYIHPGKPVNIGDFVLVQIRPPEGESTPKAVLKRLVKRSPTKITLEQLNPRETTEIKVSEIASIDLVVLSGRGG